MSARLATRRCLPIPHRRPFHTTRSLALSVGDRIPNAPLMENSPGTKVSLASELASGKGLIIGVPAAFSPACSESHIPAYIGSPKLRDAGKVFVVSVNDAFVMKAWARSLDPEGKAGVRFLADPGLEFTRAAGLAFDGKAVFGGDRGKRYALVTEDGRVKEIHVEPDNTGLDG
jgi:2-Cys peroxiredoxin 5